MPTTTNISNFFGAIRSSDLSTMSSMLAADPSLLRATDERGIDALTLATYSHGLAATRLLVEAGADLNQMGRMGTPLMGVAFKGDTEIAAYLLSRGADPELANAEGMTALMFAAAYGQEAMVKLLLDHGVDTTKTDQRGFTAKEHAKAKGYADVAFLL